MRRIITAFTLSMAVLLGTIIPVLAEGDIRVVLDGRELAFEQPPVIVNDRTMVPMRAIFEALGATVTWNGETRTAIGSKMGIQVRFTIDEPTMNKNYVDISLDAPAALINGYTMLPVRAVAESFGVEVGWDAETRTVNMKDLNTLSEFTTSEGYLYSGESLNGRPNGYGVLVFEDSASVQIGLFDDLFLKKGYVLFNYSDGDTYEGYMENDLYHGSGEYHWADGACYKGNFKDGESDGYGEYYWADGTYYKGNWKDDKRNGYGEIYYFDGSVYKGNFENSKRSGYGEMYYANKNYYKGNYENGLESGYGEFYYVNGDYYKGDFLDGEFHGTGICYLGEEDLLYLVTYEHGELVDMSDSPLVEVPIDQSGTDNNDSWSNDYNNDYDYDNDYNLSIKFPLHLYSNDGKTYLGKLVTNQYDRDSIFYEYGDYGSKYSRNSIWNEYGDYGSKYGNESAFYRYASKPPIIVDDNFEIVGYLTENTSIRGGVTLLELLQILKDYNQ